MPERSRPNILFITADQWRGDCVGYAGHKVVKTPHMDALAASGTAFLHHYAAAVPCGPARAAMYTGLYQMNNRSVANGAPLDHRFDNLARAARRSGYRPTLFGYTDVSADPREYDPQDPEVRTYEGVLPGFVEEQPLLGDQGPWKAWLREKGYSDDVVNAPYLLPLQPDQRISTAAAGFAAEHSQTAYLTGRLMEWLEAQPLGDASGGQGWFAHLSLIHPHPPFVAPAPYNDMYAPEEGDAFLTAEASVMAHPVAQMMADKPLSDFVPGMQGRLTDASEEDLRRIRSVYYGLITEVDAQLGRLFDHLKVLGEWDNTIIIMTSDHGEMMGDYGLMGKGGFFPESQHIPLIIRVPGLPEGQVCSEYTSAIDLFPTLLGLQGAEAYNSLDGRDLGPVLRGNTEQTGHDAAVWEFDFRGDIGLSAPSADDLAASHIQVRAQGDAVFVASPRGGPLLLDVSGRAGQTVDRAQDQAALPDVLQATQALLQFRMMHIDQTLTNIRLGGNGPRSLLDQ